MTLVAFIAEAFFSQAWSSYSANSLTRRLAAENSPPCNLSKTVQPKSASYAARCGGVSAAGPLRSSSFLPHGGRYPKFLLSQRLNTQRRRASQRLNDVKANRCSVGQVLGKYIIFSGINQSLRRRSHFHHAAAILPRARTFFVFAAGICATRLLSMHPLWIERLFNFS